MRLASERTIAEDWFAQGEYDNALQVCAKRADAKELTELPWPPVRYAKD